jgi:hypothetical protein
LNAAFSSKSEGAFPKTEVLGKPLYKMIYEISLCKIRYQQAGGGSDERQETGCGRPRQSGQIREERGFQLSGEVGDNPAKAIEKLLGAGAIVTGAFANLVVFHTFSL